MIVGDTSYIIQAILRDASLLEDETVIAPDLTLYKTVNTLWKHGTMLQDLEGSSARIDLLLEMVSAGIIQLVRPDEALVKDTYALSVRYGTPVHDMVYVALALELGLELKTFDDKQASIMSKERRGSSSWRHVQR